MTAAERPEAPASFPAAESALNAIDDALSTARGPDHPLAEPGHTSPEQALAALLLLRQLREQLAGWEPGLIETARAAGASWADLAQPLGVASRQAAERRYLRVRPGAAGSTGEQRVQATRDRRAADRTAGAWARANAADLRRLAARITALTDLPPAAGTAMHGLDTALAADDAAELLAPLAAAHRHLQTPYPDIAAQLQDLTRHLEGLHPTGESSTAFTG